MAYGINSLRRSARFDLLTPGGGGSDEDYRGSFGSYNQQESPSSRQDPVSYDPADQGPPPEQPPNGLAKLADVSMDPNKEEDDSNERLKAMIATIQGSYKPDVYSRNRNDRLLDSFPERGQPTKMDRLNAALLSVGQKDAADITEKVLQAPYYRERADWVAKTEPFYKAAQLEGTANNQERQIIGNAVTGFSAGERTAQAEKSATQRYELGVQRNNIEKFKAEHPKWTYDTKGPRILAFDPMGGPPKDLGPSGNLTQLEKINLEGDIKRDVAEIGARGRVTAAGVSAAGRTGGQGSSVWYRDSAGGQFRFNGSQTVDAAGNPYEPQGEFNKIPTEPRDPMDTSANQAGELKLKMGRIYATEEGRKWLVRNNDGSFTPKKRPTPGYFSDNAEEIAEYDRVMKAIWPDYTPNIPAPTVPPPQANNGGGPPIRTGPGDGTLRSRAADELKKRGKPVTQRNIDEVIRRGLVK